MKALSIKQPWAQLIAQGDKTIEVRSWVTKYRGPLLIVASRSPIVSAPLEDGTGTRILPVGAAICVVGLVSVRPLLFSDVEAACLSAFPPGQWAWILENPRPVRPVPVMGRLKIFEVDLDLEKILT